MSALATLSRTPHETGRTLCEVSRRARVAAWAAAACCLAGCTTPRAPEGASPEAPSSARARAAPATRVVFSAPARRSLRLGDRIEVFDRISFSEPSAIAYDAERDLYWVSNVSGLNRQASSKGFISRLDPEGRIATLNYVDGNRKDVDLDSPRGLTIRDRELIVADGSAIRRFDAETGEPLPSIEIDGASHLSDVAIGPAGAIYATDVGSDANLASIQDTGGDAVYRVMPSGEVRVVARRPNLGGPYAVLANESGLWVTCAGTNELLLLVPREDDQPISEAGRLALPARSPRGLTSMPDGTFLISSWSDGIVYRGHRDGPFEPVVQGLETPADVGYDTKRKRVLIPLSRGHALAIFELDPAPAPAPNEPPAPGDESAP